MAVGQARNVKDIQAAAVGLAAAWLDVDESTIAVNVTMEIPEAAAELFAQAKKNEDRTRGCQRSRTPTMRGSAHPHR
jgi:hypothetical protein